MEIVKLKIEGSFRLVFRKSMPLKDKIKNAETLKSLLKTTTPVNIVKGELVIYDTPNTDKIEYWTSELFKLQNNSLGKFMWDSHIR